MVRHSKEWLMLGAFFSIFLFFSCAYSAVNYPYSSGQVIFVQSPYNSSLYTNYNYNVHESAPQRLPNYTTNQAVFVAQPYSTTQQTVASYPSTYLDGLARTESRYMTPSAYPTTVAPAYPYANVSGYAASPYPTTSQTTTYNYPYRGKDNMTVYTYPYTTNSQTVAYPPPTVERLPTTYTSTATYSSPGAISSPRNAPAYTGDMYPGYPSATYNAYPISTVSQYPYPITSSTIPGSVVQPVKSPTR